MHHTALISLLYPKILHKGNSQHCVHWKTIHNFFFLKPIFCYIDVRFIEVCVCNALNFTLMLCTCVPHFYSVWDLKSQLPLDQFQRRLIRTMQMQLDALVIFFFFFNFIGSDDINFWSVTIQKVSFQNKLATMPRCDFSRFTPQAQAFDMSFIRSF